jgi:hypothetical protein
MSPLPSALSMSVEDRLIGMTLATTTLSGVGMMSKGVGGVTIIVAGLVAITDLEATLFMLSRQATLIGVVDSQALTRIALPLVTSANSSMLAVTPKERLHLSRSERSLQPRLSQDAIFPSIDRMQAMLMTSEVGTMSRDAASVTIIADGLEARALLAIQ